jgi:Ca2+-binding RTX toxin-like protein
MAAAGLAQAANTTVVFPDAVETVSGFSCTVPPRPSVPCAPATNALADDGVRAKGEAGANGTADTVPATGAGTFSSNGDFAVFSFPSFNIPANSRIDGIEVFLDGQSASKASPNDVRWVVALYDGAAYSVAKPGPSLALGTCTPIDVASDCDNTLGSPTDTWGLPGLAASDFEDAGGFRLYLEAQAKSSTATEPVAGIDSVSVKVYFTPPYTVTVNKDWTNVNGPAVNVTLTCSSGTVTPPSAMADNGRPAVFVVTDYDAGTTCTVSEPALPGITSSNDCADPITLGSSSPFTYSCTISNTAPALCAGMTFDRVLGGTDDNNVINGSGLREIISGLGGNDTINGGAGNDCILGGTGNDTIDGGSGNDRIDGEADTDSANGNSGNDACTAESETACES